jgi:LacI family transcriptional regulator
VLYTDEIIRGSSWRASQLGYSLFACAIQMGKELPANPLQQLYSTVDGLILTDRVVNNVKVMRIAKRMHAVHLSGAGDSQFGGTIRVDNAGGIEAVVRHLREVHGVATFGFVGGTKDSPDATARRDAFLAGVQSVGGTAAPQDILIGDFSVTQAEYAISERLTLTDPLPEVLVCANDQMAIGIMGVLRKRGISVPGQLLITGFDNIPLSRAVSPGLTTVTQPSFELGVRAVNMVVGLLDGDVGIGTVDTLPASLVVRGSCGCPEPLTSDLEKL